MSAVPEDLRYTKEHEWARGDATLVWVGITDHAQSELGDIVFIEPPEIGRTVKAMEAVTVVESVKSVSDIYSPVSGTIREFNAELEARPELVNEDPYGKGRIFAIEPSDPSDLDALLDSAGYRELLGE